MTGPVLNRFLHWAAVGAISPVLALLVLSRGAAMGELPLAFAVSSTAAVILELPSGVLADLLGRRRVYLMAVALGLLSVGAILFGSGLAAILAGFALFGASRAFASGSIEALYIDDFLARHGSGGLHRIVAAMNMAEASGLALGALAGGFAPRLWEALGSPGGRYGGNLAAEGLLLAGAGLVALFGRTREERREAGERGACHALLRESAGFLRGSAIARAVLVGAAAWGFCFFAVETYWQPRLRDLARPGGGEILFGALNSAYFLAAMAGSLAASVLLAPRRTARPALVGMLRLAMGGLVALMGLAAGPASFGVCFVGLMVLNGAAGVPEGTALNEAAPPAVRASFLSLASLTGQAGGILAALAFGGTAAISIAKAWTIAGAILAASAAAYLLAARSGCRPAQSAKAGRGAASTSSQTP